MGYRHLTTNLKPHLKKQEMQEHLNLLQRTFKYYQSTGYSMPDGENWEKSVSKTKYLIYPVDSGFGIAVDIGGKPHSNSNYRMCTIYPSLNIAVIDDECGKEKSVRKKSIIRKIMELGYTITEKRSHKNSGKKSFLPHPYHIAVETVKIYKSKAVLDQVLKNINAIVENRPGIDACEIVAFSPPGDGGWNSPIGKTSDEKEYGTILEKGAEFIVPIIGGKVKAEKIADIFNSFDQKYAIGVSSRRNPINGDSTFEEVLSHDLLCHTPMIDFKCSSPEEAIHTIERRGIPILKSGVVLVDSGHSFHAHFPKAIQNRKESDNYLDNLVNNEEVCEKWVPLQKEQDYQLLRVSPCIRKPRMPIVLNL